jgi:hypothetical protein
MNVSSIRSPRKPTRPRGGFSYALKDRVKAFLWYPLIRFTVQALAVCVLVAVTLAVLTACSLLAAHAGLNLCDPALNC